MQTSNLMKIIVSAIIGVTVFAAILIPVIGEATTTEKTLTNEGAFYVEADPSDSYTISYDLSSNQGILVINGEDLEAPFGGYSVLILDKSVLRAESTDYTLQYRGDGQSIAGISELDITVADGEVTGTYRLKWDSAETSDRTWPTTTYTEAYVASPTEQNLVMSEYNNPVYMHGDSELFAFGQSTVGSTSVLIKIEGTIDDGVTVDILDRTTGEALSGATVTNLSVNSTEAESYVGTYELNSITFTATLQDESTSNITFSAYVVPSAVTSELSAHPDASQIALINIIPMLVLVGLVLGVVGAVIARRD